MAARQGIDEAGQGVLVGGDLIDVGDLGPGFFGSDGVEVVGQPSPAEGGVAGLLEQGVGAEEKTRGPR